MIFYGYSNQTPELDSYGLPKFRVLRRLFTDTTKSGRVIFLNLKMGLGRNLDQALQTFAPWTMKEFPTIARMCDTLKCSVVLMEMNILMYEITKTVTTGEALFYWFVTLLHRYEKDTLVLVSDDYTRVPEQKHVEQAIRASARARAPPKFVGLARGVTDDFCSPEMVVSSSAMIFDAICYLLNRLAQTPLDYTLYITCPSPKVGGESGVCINGTVYRGGRNIVIPQAGVPAVDPPHYFMDGEGELIGWLWMKWLHDKQPDARFLFRSIDTDNCGIAMMCSDRVLVAAVNIELKPRRGGDGSTRRIFQCSGLMIHSQELLRDFLLLVVLGGGSDFCRGVRTEAPIPGTGIISIMKLKRARGALCELVDKGIVVTDALRQMMLQVVSPAAIVELAPVFESACWNLSYWQQLLERNEACLSPSS